MAHADDEVIEKEDFSDLYYDRDLKVLLEDHRQVTKFAMLVAILVMILQMAFSVWSLTLLSEKGSWENALLINWFHLLKLLMNLYVT